MSQRWLSSTEPSGGSSSSSPRQASDPPRSRRRKGGLGDFDESKVYQGSVNMIGPPDAVSNIRPVLYAKPRRYFPTSASNPSSLASNRSSNSPHPYSDTEFGHSDWKRARKNSKVDKWTGLNGMALRTEERLQEAELKMRLCRTSGDALTQRFWKDNNSRFVADLERARKNGEEPKLVSSSDKPEDKMTVVDRRNTQGVESIDSAFYARWLDANGARHRAYNILVWKQAAQEVKLGARVAWLKFLLRMIGRL